MSKKTFISKGGFESLLENPSPTSTETVKTEKNEPAYKKITIRLESKTINSIKEIAYWDRISVTKFIENALELAIKEHKNKK